MSTPLTRVHAAIVAVCPDVLELKFGCEVRGMNNTWRLIHLGNPETAWDLPFQFINKSGACWSTTEKPDFEILGRPITLCHVLRAIEKRTAQDDWRMPYWFGLDTDGNGNARFTHMYGDGKNEGYELTCISWNLKNDSLDAQSPETLEFLCSILCV